MLWAPKALCHLTLAEHLPLIWFSQIQLNKNTKWIDSYLFSTNPICELDLPVFFAWCTSLSLNHSGNLYCQAALVAQHSPRAGWLQLPNANHSCANPWAVGHSKCPLPYLLCVLCRPRSPPISLWLLQQGEQQVPSLRRFIHSLISSPVHTGKTSKAGAGSPAGAAFLFITVLAKALAQWGGQGKMKG